MSSVGIFNRVSRGTARLACSVAFAAILLGVSSAAASAATFTVNNTSDATGTCPTPTTCSFRQALGSANATAGDDTITFSIPNGSTILLTNGSLPISPTTTTDNLTVVGLGANQLTIQRSTGTAPIFSVTAGTSTLSGMEITGGSGGAFIGPAIEATGGTLTLDSVLITGNTSNAGGGSNGSSGAIVSVGTAMTIKNSTLSNNTVTNSGTGASGGAIVSLAPLTLINTTISGNAVTGSGGSDGGAILNFAPLTTVNATIANNSAVGGSGGVENGGGSFMPANTILATNTGSTGPDCANTGTVTSQGYNLIGNNTGCTFTPATGDQVGTGASPINPLLGALGDNGGPTPTMSLLTNSPAINAGNPAAVSDATAPAPPALIPCATTDQRGVSRPQGAFCDIGAFEFRTAAFSASPTITGTPQVGQTLTCNPPTIINPDGGTVATTFTWLRDGAAIASGQTHVVTATDAGHVLTCRVTATNAAGPATATSAGVAVPAPVVNPPAPVLTVLTSKVVGQTVVAVVGCAGSTCVGDETLTTREKLRAGKIIGVQAAKKPRIRFRTVVVGRKHFTLAANQRLSITAPLNATGRSLLKRFGRLPVTLKITLTVAGKTTTIVSRRLTIVKHKKKKKTHARRANAAAPLSSNAAGAAWRRRF